MSALFKLACSDTNQYQFEFINGRGELILISPEYASQKEAEEAIQQVRVGSMMSQHIAKSTTASGEHFFLINNSAGQPVAKSVLFANEMVFNNALHSVRENACIAEVKVEAA